MRIFDRIIWYPMWLGLAAGLAALVNIVYVGVYVGGWASIFKASSDPWLAPPAVALKSYRGSQRPRSVRRFVFCGALELHWLTSAACHLSAAHFWSIRPIRHHCSH